MRSYLILTLYIFAVFGLLLFNDAIFGDGTVDAYWISTGNWEQFTQAWHATGYWSPPYLYRAIAFFPDFVFGFKLTSFVCILVIGWSVLASLKRLSILPEPYNVLATCMMLSFPVFNFWAEAIDFALFVICLAAFYVAVYAYIRFQLDGIKWMGVVAGVLFFFSFQLASLMVYLMAIFIGISLYQWKTIRPIQEKAVLFLKQHHVFLVLPPVQFLLINILLPKQAPFTYYNSLLFSPGTWLLTLIKSVGYLIIEPVADLFGFFLHETFSAFAIGMLCAGITWKIVRLIKLHPLKESQTLDLGYLRWAMLAGALGLVPYILVGKGIGMYQSARFAVLMGFPTAIFLIIASIWMKTKYRKPAFYALLVLFWAFNVHTIKDLMLWQNREIKMKAITTNLQAVPESEIRPMVYFGDLTDWGMPLPYVMQELNFILYNAFGNTSHCGQGLHQGDFEDRGGYELWESSIYLSLKGTLDKAQTFGPYLIMEDFKVREPDTVTLVKVLPTKAYNELELFFQYYRHSGESRQEFLKGLVQLEVKPVDLGPMRERQKLLNPTKTMD